MSKKEENFKKIIIFYIEIDYLLKNQEELKTAHKNTLLYPQLTKIVKA